MSNKLQKISISDHALIISQGKVYHITTAEQSQNTASIEPFNDLLAENIIFVLAGYGNSFAINAQNQVFGWGNNQYGELGLGHSNSCDKPKFIAPASVHGIIKIVAGEHFTVMLDKHGKIYTCGVNELGQLGIGSYVGSTVLQEVVGLQDKCIVDIAASKTHALALTKEGEVFAWGRLTSIGLERGGQLLNSNLPIQIDSEHKILKIAACTNTILLLTERGEVLACGSNDLGLTGYGKYWLGSGDLTSVFAIKEKVVDLVVGKEHVIAVTENNIAYGWGKNYSFHPLGSFAVNGICEDPTPIILPNEQKIAKVVAGDALTIFFSQDEQIYLLGHNIFREANSIHDQRDDHLGKVDSQELRSLLQNSLRPESIPLPQEKLGKRMLEPEKITHYGDISFFVSRNYEGEQAEPSVSQIMYGL